MTSRSSVVGRVTMLRTGWSGFRIPIGPKNLSILQDDKTGSVAHSPFFYPILMFFLGGVNRSAPEVNHSPHLSAEMKNEWSYTPIPHYITSWRGEGKILFPFLLGYDSIQYDLVWKCRCKFSVHQISFLLVAREQLVSHNS